MLHVYAGHPVISFRFGLLVAGSFPQSLKATASSATTDLRWKILVLLVRWLGFIRLPSFTACRAFTGAAKGAMGLLTSCRPLHIVSCAAAFPVTLVHSVW
jgi:hypothetical protein